MGVLVMSAGDPQLSPIDLRLQVLMTMLGPVAALSRVAGLSLEDLHELVSVAYFRELKLRGMSWQGIAQRLKRSRRYVANLSKLASATVPPLPKSRQVRWRRQIVRAIARHGSADLDQVCGELPDATRDDLEAELQQLVEAGILEREGERFRVVTELVDLVQGDLEHRLDSLRHFLDGVTHVVYRRFFTRPSEAEAFARVLTFSGFRTSISKLREQAYDNMYERIVSVDAEAEGDESAVQATVGLIVVETPTDLAFKPRSR